MLLPAVAEGMKAFFWAEKGQLSVVYPDGVPAQVVEACEVASQAKNLFELERMKK